MALETLTAQTFQHHLNKVFRLVHSAATLDLVLATVEDAGQGLSRRAFSLIFSAPSEPVMPQGIYRLDNAATGPLDIFLVPLGPEKGVFRYQAVFT